MHGIVSLSGDEEKGYNSIRQEWEYQRTCGVRIGSPERPVTLDGKPPEEDWSNVLSPKPRFTEYTDYEKLFKIIIAKFEALGLTWNIEQKTIEHGKVIKRKFQDSFITEVAETVALKLIAYRAKLINEAKNLKTGAEKRKSINEINELNYQDLVEEIRHETPPTPVIERESKWVELAKRSLKQE